MATEAENDKGMEDDSQTIANGAVRSKGQALSGWLGRLMESVGLAEAPNLREVLEGALVDENRADLGFTVEERKMLSRLLDFGATRVDELVVPRADIIAIEESESLVELMRLFEDAGVSRIPIFRETLDDPRGMVHIKDLFRWMVTEVSGSAPGGEGSAAGANDASPDKPDFGRLDLMRPISAVKIRRSVLYVPPSMPAINLLVRMQTSRIHMALVIDEYGGTDGLVTIEDLVEQIVGDIEDEHDEEEASYITMDPKLGLVASARTPVSELDERLGVTLLSEDEEEDIDTLGGLIFQLVGRIPARGEIVRHSSGVEFEVLDADLRRIKRLKIHTPARAQEALGSG